MTAAIKHVGIIGARGHTGGELIRLIAGHPCMDLAFVSSRELDGQRVDAHNSDYTGDLRFENLDAQAVAKRGVDAVILALPNGASDAFVAALDEVAAQTVIVDLSADHRFDGAWYYGLPELSRDRYRGQRRIANPGCYATAIQLSVAPLKGWLAGPPVCFGVSGYSGAGTTPSPRNDPEQLRDNLMPYSLVGHVHERESSRQLGLPVEFMPHVAPHFRGLTVTTNLYLSRSIRVEEVTAHYRARYHNEPLVCVLDDAPWVSRIAGRHHAELGGFAVAADGKRVVLAATLDNLLKGAATQALQNLNRAFTLPETMGILLPDATNPVATATR